MTSTWVEDPLQRPTFQQVLKELNSISPQKGDLMDNLVNMVWIPSAPSGVVHLHNAVAIGAVEALS